MTNIQVTYAGQEQQHKTITSLEVAEMVERRHDQVIRDIEKIITHLEGAHKNVESYFELHGYTDKSNRINKMYRITKKGCELYSTRMTGAKGTTFAVAYIERFNEMEEVIQQQLPSDPLELALTAALETRKEVAEIRTDVDFLKNNMRINTYQEKVLQDIVKQKVLKALGGYKSEAYSALASRCFKSAWRDFKNHFMISSYKELPAEKFDEGVQLLNLWEPSASLKLEIAAYTRQIEWEMK